MYPNLKSVSKLQTSPCSIASFAEISAAKMTAENYVRPDKSSAEILSDLQKLTRKVAEQF
jgi:hypothetical protein